MVYGDIYSKIPTDLLTSLSGIKAPFFLKIARLYFRVFGYPDIAGNGRFAHVIKMLEPKRGEGILDIGCGNGIYANSFSFHFGAKVIGIDIDKKRIKIANEIANSLENKAEFICRDAEKLNFPRQSFDKIICLEVIEHISNDRSLINKLSSFLKKGGIFVISTVKKERLSEKRELEKFKNAKKGKHVRSGYEFAEFKEMLNGAGFQILERKLYYRFFAKVTIRIQQYLYKKNLNCANILTYPILLFFSKLDFLIPENIGWYRGFIIKAIKK